MCVRVLELPLQSLCALKEWQKAVFLGEGVVAVLPESAQARFWLVCGLAQTGRLDEARAHAKAAAALKPELRIEMLDEPALADLW
jgi:hypothetical protein